MPSLSIIGETSALQAKIETRAPIMVRGVDTRAGFRSGTPGRRAQDAQVQDANARARAPIFDLRATNRQAARPAQPFDTGRTPVPANASGAIEASVETFARAVGAQAAEFRAPASGGPGERNALRRMSVNDAYLSAEALDGAFAHRGSFFDLQI